MTQEIRCKTDELSAQNAASEFWTEKLRGLVGTAILPADGPRKPSDERFPMRLSRQLSVAQSKRLQDFAIAERFAESDVFLAALAMFLHRRSPQADAVIGELRAPWQQESGPNIDPLAIYRIVWSHEPSVRDAIRDVATQRAYAEANPCPALNTLIREPDQALQAHHPLYQVGYRWRSAAEVAITSGRTPFPLDLLLEVSRSHGSFSIEVVYPSSLFVPETLDRWMGSIESLLQDLIDRPSASIAELRILSAREEEEVLQWGTGVNRKWDVECIHACFSRLAAKLPATPAVVFGDREMTYEQLDDRSGRLAARLGQLGVGSGVVVGVCAERSFRMWEAVLAIFKCGAICLPLDLTYPKDWVAFVVKDAQCEIVLTYRQSPPALPTQRQFDLCNEDWLDLTPLPSADDSDQVIYVCYTSGSTGRPKGVMFVHRALGNIVRAHRGQMPSPSVPRTLQFASLNFDVSFHETFFTWLSGGTVFLIEDADRKNPERLLAVINAHGIDTVFMPPSMLRLMAESVHDGNAPRSLQNIVVSGERLEITPAVRALHERLPTLNIHNHYGSNESHVVTIETLAGHDKEWPTFPLAGTPVANTSVHVLDRNMRLVPVGVAGEAYLGGAGLARGYINQPNLTNERFVPNPFGAVGSLLYRSGDMVRWCTNGKLEYLGRHDLQIKIRGYRVELEEIEAVLLMEAELAEAIVTAGHGSSGETFLIAYVVMRNGCSFDISALRARLKSRLPAYMVPAAIVQLKSLPLNHNGKLQRDLLPVPDKDAYEAEAYEAPLTLTEQTIIRIWTCCLRVEPIGRSDNFFNLGGDSLTAMRMLAALRKENIQLDLPSLLRNPTPAQLANVVSPSHQYSSDQPDKGTR